MSVGIFLVATGKYIEFIPPLYDDLKKYFLPSMKVNVYLFTDSDEVPEGVYKIPTQWKPWPHGTLFRYNMITDFAKFANPPDDFYYYLDADMRVVDTVGEEILGDLVACYHPGFWKFPDKNAHCKEIFSHAFTPKKLIRAYYCGAVNGGRNYLKMAETISGWVNKDQKHGHIPPWHDESYLNRYLAENPPDISLTPDYCFPDNGPHIIKWHLTGLKPKIKCLYKDEKYRD